MKAKKLIAHGCAVNLAMALFLRPNASLWQQRWWFLCAPCPPGHSRCAKAPPTPPPWPLVRKQPCLRWQRVFSGAGTAEFVSLCNPSWPLASFPGMSIAALCFLTIPQRRGVCGVAGLHPGSKGCPACDGQLKLAGSCMAQLERWLQSSWLLSARPSLLESKLKEFSGKHGVLESFFNHKFCF